MTREVDGIHFWAAYVTAAARCEVLQALVSLLVRLVSEITTGYSAGHSLYHPSCPSPSVCNRVQKNLFFLKAQPIGFFAVLLGFGLHWVFPIFYSNEQLGSLLVDLGHQLSFYLYSPVL